MGFVLRWGLSQLKVGTEVRPRWDVDNEVATRHPQLGAQGTVRRTERFLKEEDIKVNL